MFWLGLAFVTLFGLILGSFVNALEWRLRRQRLANREDIDDVAEDGEQDVTSRWRTLLNCFIGVGEEIRDWFLTPFRALNPKHHKKPTGAKAKREARYSLATGRSMCPHCEHELAAKDLVPLLSWLGLRGKCRYCHKPISLQYPLVEALTAILFALTYVFWPYDLTEPFDVVRLALWLAILTGFVALALYDAKYRYLPNEVLYPLLWLTVLLVALETLFGGQGAAYVLLHAAFGVACSWGLFFAIWCASQVLDRRLIGYGDVRLAVLIGLAVGGPLPALAVIFLASLLGSLTIIPFMAAGKANRSSEIPYGPFLLLATAGIYLCAAQLTDWFYSLFIVA